MIRGIFILAFVAGLAFTPVYLFEHTTMPQLLGLKQAYGGAEAIVSQAVGVNL